MKFTFFKRKKEKEELKLKIAMLEKEKKDLINKLKDVKLSKNKKINKLAEEFTILKRISDDEVAYYEDKLNLYRKTEGTVQKLIKQNYELSLLIPEKFPVAEIMEKCAKAAWNGTKSDKIFKSTDGKIKLYFSGIIYEPCYEDFTSGCCVYYLEEGMDKRKSLYTIDGKNVAAYKNEIVETGSIENIRNYLISKNVGFTEV